jgi:hypothetical protein
MTEATLRAVYGLKYNPFLPALPPEALWCAPGAEHFALRLETLVAQGGFALVSGEPGQGKSKALHWLSHRLTRIPDLVIDVMERPQSKLGDFYRELGELFGVALTPANRYGGFKALRTRWQAHCDSTLRRAVLLIDEAQEVSSQCLTLKQACFSDQIFFNGHLRNLFNTISPPAALLPKPMSATKISFIGFYSNVRIFQDQRKSRRFPMHVSPCNNPRPHLKS